MIGLKEALGRPDDDRTTDDWNLIDSAARCVLAAEVAESDVDAAMIAYESAKGDCWYRMEAAVQTIRLRAHQPQASEEMRDLIVALREAHKREQTFLKARRIAPTTQPERPTLFGMAADALEAALSTGKEVMPTEAGRSDSAAIPNCDSSPRSEGETSGGESAKGLHEDTVTDARKLAHEINSDVMAGEEEIAAAIEAGFRFRDRDAFARGAAAMREACAKHHEYCCENALDIDIEFHKACAKVIRALPLPTEPQK